MAAVQAESDELLRRSEIRSVVKLTVCRNTAGRCSTSDLGESFLRFGKQLGLTSGLRGLASVFLVFGHCGG